MDEDRPLPVELPAPVLKQAQRRISWPQTVNVRFPSMGITGRANSGPSRPHSGTGRFDRGCAKTPAFNLRVESSSRFGQSENQKFWRRLFEEGNRENGSTLSWLAHVFTWPGPKAGVQNEATHQTEPVKPLAALARVLQSTSDGLSHGLTPI